MWINLLSLEMTGEKQDRDANTDGGGQCKPEREREEVRDRTHEDRAMHGAPGGRLGALDGALETHEYPTTTDEVVEAYGDYLIETQGGEESIKEVFAQTDNQTFDSADDVRSRILGLIHR